MKRRIISMVMALAFCLSLLPTAVFAADDGKIVRRFYNELWIANADTHFHPITDSQGDVAVTFAHKLSSENGALYVDGMAQNKEEANGQAYYLLPTGTYYIVSDLELDGELRIVDDKRVDLCLNGHGIISQTDTKYGTISLFNTARLDLCDCQKSGIITHGADASGNKYNGRGVYCDSNTMFNMFGGKITGNHLKNAGSILDTSGSAILASSTSVAVYNGKISGNTCESAIGAGIYCSNAGHLSVGGKAKITDVVALTTISDLDAYSSIGVIETRDTSLPAIPLRADPNQYTRERPLVFPEDDSVVLRPEDFDWKYGISDQPINKKLELDENGRLVAEIEKIQPVDATGVTSVFYPAAYFTCPSGMTLGEIAEALEMYDPRNLAYSVAGSWTFLYGDTADDVITAENVGQYGYLAEFEPFDSKYYKKSAMYTFYVDVSDVSEISIDFANEKLKGMDVNGTYTINRMTPPDMSNVSLGASFGQTLTIAKQTIANDKYDASSKAVYISVQKLSVPERPAAPTGLAAVKTSASGRTGQITGVNDKMQYRNVSSTTWQDCNGTSVTGLAKGNYEVRYKATDTGFASEPTTVVVDETTSSGGSGSSSSGGNSSVSTATYPITAPSKTDNVSVSISPKSAKKGATVTITVTPDKGYTLETLTVLDKDGKEIKLTKKNDTQYTFTMPASKVEINAAFVKKVEISPFSDVSTSACYYEAVKWAQEKGITGGIGNGLFGPNQPCTRAQIVTFLWRAAGSPVVNYAMNMSDVPEGSYYAEAVRWALSEGITTGTTENTFSPDSECTRAQAVAFLFRYAASEAVTLQELVSGFSDADSVPGYALPAMNWALAEEIVQGNGSKLMPNDSCTRAQIVTFLFRAYQGK